MTSQETKDVPAHLSSGYAVKVQAVRSKGVADRPYVIIPVPIAKALGIQKGEVVQWNVVDRSQLLLVRKAQPSPVKVPPKK